MSLKAAPRNVRVIRGAAAPGRSAESRPTHRRAGHDEFRGPGIREALVAEAKARLASGFYDLPECLDWAADRMIAGAQG